MILFCARSGRMDGVDSDNRATSAQVQMNLPTRAELGNIRIYSPYYDTHYHASTNESLWKWAFFKNIVKSFSALLSLIINCHQMLSFALTSSRGCYISKCSDLFWHLGGGSMGQMMKICRPKHLKTKGGSLGWKKYLFHKSSQISTRIGSKDQKFCTDSKNIYINWCWCVN